MPFTPSHAVVALPFAASETLRSAGIPAAIAVGAMTPDLPLFVRGTPIDYGWTHSFAWLPLTSVLAFALLLVWRCVLRPATRELSPRWLAARLPDGWDAGAAASARETVDPAAWRSRRIRTVFPLVLAAALVLGVASHLGWDLFTHEGRAGIPALDAMWGPLPAYRWLQYASSVAGLAVIAVWGVVWLRGAAVAPSVARLAPAWVRWAWWLSLPVILVAAWTIGAASAGPFTPEFTPQHLAYRVLPPACGVWAGATVALCVVIQVVRATRRPRRAG